MLARQFRFTSLIETKANTLFSNPARRSRCFSSSASTWTSHGENTTVTGPPLNRPHLRLQYAARGQNLSDRYKRLEKSLRGKQELESEIRDFEEIEESGLEKATPREEHLATPSGSGLRKAGREVEETFYGFKIPKEPKPPGDDECCMSGCAICIYDLYDDSLEEYRKSVSTLRASLRTMKVPEEEWPVSLREKKVGGGEKGGGPERKSTQEVTLNAFEEMERRLAAKAQTANQSQKASGTDLNIDASSILANRHDTFDSTPSAAEALAVARAQRRNAIPPPPPPTFKERMVELKEGIRWALFSNR